MPALSKLLPVRLLKAGFLLFCSVLICFSLLMTSMKERHCSMPKPTPSATSVDFLVLVLTLDRADSLRTCLRRLDKMIVDDDGSVGLNIWIDRDKNNRLDGDTYRVAADYQWTVGATSVRVHDKHAGVYGQWLDTWQPSPPDRQTALFVEDDVDVSPYAYRWLRKVQAFYTHRNDIAMFCLQDINAVRLDQKRHRVEIERDPASPVFLYRIPGSWGCSPHPTHWRHFRLWFQTKMAAKDPSFHPYVTEAQLHTDWYKKFERENRPDSMWTMWFIYYCNEHRLFGLYSNLPQHTGMDNVSLSVNRKEAGMHYNASKVALHTHDMLLRFWRDDFVKFPSDPPMYDYDGRRMH